MNNKRLYIYHSFLSRDPKLGQFHSIKSLINQLDYIKELGMNAVLTNPIFESSDNSHGYHIQNFYEIDSRLGTMNDFEELLKELKKRDMYFIMDICLQHCSDQSYYYKDFLQGKNDFFVVKSWRENDTVTNLRNSKYEYRKDVNGYLVAPFNGMIPALNVDSPNVRNEMKNVLNFWLRKSDNIHLRADAIMHNKWANKNHDGIPYAKFIREVVDEINPNIQIIAEVWNEYNLRNEPIEYNKVLRNTFDFYNVFSLVHQIREGRSYDELYIDQCYPCPTTIFTSNHDTSTITSMLDNNINKVKMYLKAIVEKSRDCDNVSFYYGVEENRPGLLWDCSDEVVRQPYDVFDMARVIQDKDSLFYYIKDLIKKDKERRGIK